MTLVAVGQRCQALHVGAWSVARVEMVSCTVGTCVQVQCWLVWSVPRCRVIVCSVLPFSSSTTFLTPHQVPVYILLILIRKQIVLAPTVIAR